MVRANIQFDSNENNEVFAIWSYAKIKCIGRFGCMDVLQRYFFTRHCVYLHGWRNMKNCLIPCITSQNQSHWSDIGNSSKYLPFPSKKLIFQYVRGTDKCHHGSWNLGQRHFELTSHNMIRLIIIVTGLLQLLLCNIWR